MVPNKTLLYNYVTNIAGYGKTSCYRIMSRDNTHARNLTQCYCTMYYFLQCFDTDGWVI